MNKKSTLNFELGHIYSPDENPHANSYYLMVIYDHGGNKAFLSLGHYGTHSIDSLTSKYTLYEINDSEAMDAFWRGISKIYKKEWFHAIHK